MINVHFDLTVMAAEARRACRRRGSGSVAAGVVMPTRGRGCLPLTPRRIMLADQEPGAGNAHVVVLKSGGAVPPTRPPSIENGQGISGRDAAGGDMPTRPPSIKNDNISTSHRSNSIVLTPNATHTRGFHPLRGRVSVIVVNVLNIIATDTDVVSSVSSCCLRSSS